MHDAYFGFGPELFDALDGAPCAPLSALELDALAYDTAPLASPFEDAGVDELDAFLAEGARRMQAADALLEALPRRRGRR